MASCFGGLETVPKYIFAHLCKQLARGHPTLPINAQPLRLLSLRPEQEQEEGPDGSAEKNRVVG